ncbi:MAG: alpha-E domain-containing protein [Alphaproteobacteria bacterium]
MLSRTADNLYWMGRYIERAENHARILDVAHRLSMMPTTPESAETQWKSVVTISGGDEIFPDAYDQADDRSVLAFMALDPDNPSSIYSCIHAARENCRAMRHAVPSEVWQSLNTTWIEIRDMTEARIHATGPQQFFDWVKERSSLFRGVSVGTMLQDEAFHFTRLGTFVERGDSTARILDVKYHVLLPQGEDIGGATDYYQWAALLRSVSAFRNYRALYGTDVQPMHVAELLILVEAMPRSLHHCQNEITHHLDALAGHYGQRHECHRLAGETHARLRFGKIDHIFDQGLHEYLTDYVERNARLGVEIADNFLLNS